MEPAQGEIGPLLYLLHFGESSTLPREASLDVMANAFGMEMPSSNWTVDQAALHDDGTLRRITVSGYGFICVVEALNERRAERAAATLAGEARPGLVIVEGRFLVFVCSCLQAIAVQMEYEGLGDTASSAPDELGVHITEARTFIHIAVDFDEPRSCHSTGSGERWKNFQLPSLPRDRSALLPASLAVEPAPTNPGSAHHASGRCRVCIYHVRGKCVNGDECAFCHEPSHKRTRGKRRKRRNRTRNKSGDVMSGDGSDDDDDDDYCEGDVGVIYEV